MTDFDPTKPVQTRDGRKARVLCTDAVGDYPIRYLTLSRNGLFEVSGSATSEGWQDCDRRSEELDGDLINIPEIPRGLRGLRYPEAVQGVLTLDDVVQYLEKHNLAIVPREANPTMLGALDDIGAPGLSWEVAIEAYEKNKD